MKSKAIDQIPKATIATTKSTLAEVYKITYPVTCYYDIIIVPPLDNRVGVTS